MIYGRPLLQNITKNENVAMSRKCRVFTIIFILFFFFSLLASQVVCVTSLGLCNIFPVHAFSIGRKIYYTCGAGSFYEWNIRCFCRGCYTFNAAKEQGMPLVEGSPRFLHGYMGTFGTWDITFAGWDVNSVCVIQFLLGFRTGWERVCFCDVVYFFISLGLFTGPAYIFRRKTFFACGINYVFSFYWRRGCRVAGEKGMHEFWRHKIFGMEIKEMWHFFSLVFMFFWKYGNMETFPTLVFAPKLVRILKLWQNILCNIVYFVI